MTEDIVCFMHVLSKLSVIQKRELTTTLFVNCSAAFFLIVVMKKVNNQALCEELLEKLESL